MQKTFFLTVSAMLIILAPMVAMAGDEKADEGRAGYYNHLIGEGNVCEAAKIARDGKLGDEKVRSAATRCYDDYVLVEDWLSAAQTAADFGLGQDRIDATAPRGYTVAMLKTTDFSWCDMIPYSRLVKNTMPERTLAAFCLVDVLRWERDGGRGDFHGWYSGQLKTRYEFGKTELEAIAKRVSEATKK